MKIQCPKCGYSGNLADQLIPDEGRTIGCPKCKERFSIKKPIVPAGDPNEFYEIERNTTPMQDIRTERETIPVPVLVPSEVSATNQPTGANIAVCPRCGSPSITLAKQGFGGKKGACGCCILGPIGLLAGLFGSGKTQSVCMKCGHKWNKR